MTRIFLRWLDPEGGATQPLTIFQDRSGRAIAVLRLLLASIFLLAVYFEPSQPVHEASKVYALLGGYLTFSLVAVAVAWRSWWYDFKLSLPAWCLDLFMFASSALATEGGEKEFGSPVLAFYVFLVVSAALRWNWRATAAAAAAVSLIYMGVGFLSWDMGLHYDAQQFARRLSYMIVIGMVFVIFASQRGPVKVDPPVDTSGGDPLQAALRYATWQAGALHALLLWDEPDEPRKASQVIDGQVATFHEDVNLLPLDDRAARLFDLDRRRELFQRSSNSRTIAHREIEHPAMARAMGIRTGLSAPLFAGRMIKGRLFLGGMNPMSVDDLIRVREIAKGVVSLIEGRRLAELASIHAVAQTREALARDLHDSVAQSLAGASFGLEALRRSLSMTEGKSLQILDDLKTSLHEEQSNIRELIERLRLAPNEAGELDLSVQLAWVVRESRPRWGIEISLAVPDSMMIRAALAYECKQIVREAIANAVRHGRCRSMHIDVSAQGGAANLRIQNDGVPFPSDPSSAQPWTISQRVAALGGNMQVRSARNGTELTIELPIGTGA